MADRIKAIWELDTPPLFSFNFAGIGLNERVSMQPKRLKSKDTMADIHKEFDELFEKLGFIQECRILSAPWVYTCKHGWKYKVKFEGYAFVLYKEYKSTVPIGKESVHQTIELTMKHNVPLADFRDPKVFEEFMKMVTHEYKTDVF